MPDVIKIKKQKWNTRTTKKNDLVLIMEKIKLHKFEAWAGIKAEFF